jgi:hypothetical protein
VAITPLDRASGVRLCQAVVALVCAVALPIAAARAQQPDVSGSLSVTGRVIGSLSVTTQDELAFGTFTTLARARRVAFTDNGPMGRRGRFTIRGDGDTELLMELVVPDAMRSGVGTLPLSEWGIRVNTVDTDVGGVDAALASGVNRTSLRLPGIAGATSMLYIRLCATASPGGVQPAGAYSATVQIALNYVGA